MEPPSRWVFVRNTHLGCEVRWTEWTTEQENHRLRMLGITFPKIQRSTPVMIAMEAPPLSAPNIIQNKTKWRHVTCWKRRQRGVRCEPGRSAIRTGGGPPSSSNSPIVELKMPDTWLLPQKRLQNTSGAELKAEENEQIEKLCTNTDDASPHR